MTTNNLPISIDYTSRDFYSLKNDLISRISARVNDNGKTWTGNNPADFGVAIVEAFAHVGDVTNYYIDRMANEAYLSTAVQRQSILNLAFMYGYVPSGFRRAYVDVTISNPNTTDILVPAGSIFSVQVVYTNGNSNSSTQEFYTVLYDTAVAAGGSNTATLAHGQDVSSMSQNAADVNDAYDISGELLGYSTGLGNQSFILANNQVADGTVSVFVRNGDYFTQWVQVTELANYGPQDYVYSMSIDANNYVSINFGNGISGAIPVFGDTIKATYVVGGGLSGNIDSGQSFTIKSVPLESGVSVSSLTNIVVTNAASNGYGGDDPESNDSIRFNAPYTFRSANRAVSLIDFENIAIGIPGVGKAASYATSPNSVNLYVGLQLSDFDPTYFPGYDSTNTTVTSIWTSLQSQVQSSFANKTQIGTTLTILPPIFVPADIKVEYVKISGYSDSQIKTDIKNGIIYGYGYNAMSFDANLRPEKIEQSLASVNGVDSVKVISLNRHGATSARSTLVPSQGELFVFIESNTAIYSAASLSNLVVAISNGSLPTFSDTTYNYAFTSTSSTFTVTATAANTLSGFASVLTYTFTNGSGTTTTGSLTSGTASGTATLTTGVNTYTITVTSYDGVVINNYIIKITK